MLDQIIGSPQMGSLRCHCDSCPNNTCTTIHQGFCLAQWALNTKGELEKKFSCMNHESRLVQRLVCDTNPTKSSYDIIRCCNSANYCNLDDKILPPLEVVKRSLRNSDSNPNLVPSLFDRYSKLSLETKIVSIVLFGFLLTTVIALTQHWYTRRRSPDGRAASSSSTTSHRPQRNNGEDGDGPNIYDNHSMASKEPLISACSHHGLQHVFSANSTKHPSPLKGPWTTEDVNKGPASFAVSIGSGELAKNDDEDSSGSGSGQPYLTQRSIANDIQLMEVVGRGYFGVVWRGEYKGEPVAVKIFSSKAEPSWKREAEIYQTTMLRHKNILGLVATDKRVDLSVTAYWLVTDFYAMGSLYDFLRVNSMAMPDAIRMAFSIANGLAHLHTEIFGTQGKPAIAHRDLKSKNILVKNDGTCCLADLGMAVRYNSQTNIVDVPSNTRIGTRRYLAPELLENKLNLMDFESVKATDVYALGLVLWELLRRTCYRFPSDHTTVRYVLRPSSPRSPGLAGHMQANEQELQAASSQASTSQSGPSEFFPVPISTNHVGHSTTVSSMSGPSLQSALSDPSSQSAPSTQSIILSRSTQSSQPAQSGATSSLDMSSDHGAALDIDNGNLLNGSHRMNSGSSSSDSSRIEERSLTPEVEGSIVSSVEDLDNDMAVVVDPYQVPYQEFVSADPTSEEMRRCVCVDKVRPPVSYRWTKFAAMRDYSTLMRECWYEKSQARLSALRIRKTLGDIARRYFNLVLEYD